LFGVNHLLNVIHFVKSVDKLSHLIDGCRKSDEYLSNILFKVMIDRYPINITHRYSKKSIQSDNYWSIYSVGGVLLTERTHRQTDKQTATLIHIYNKKIYLFHHKRDFLFTRTSLTYTHYIDTNTQYRAAPRRPP